jgi:hypothetical protein
VNAFGHFLGQLIGLALVPAVLIWVLRGTRPGRVVWRAVADAVALPGKRRQLQAARAVHERYDMWCTSIRWWIRERDLQPLGAPEHAAAADMVRYFQYHRPAACYCSTCVQRCPDNPRSYQP